MSGQLGQWYVATAWFCDGGKTISGPYSTCDDALTARVTIEKLMKTNQLWVDSWAQPYKCGLHGVSSGTEHKESQQ